MWHAATYDSGKAFAEIFARWDQILEDAGVLAVVVDRTRECRAKAGKMRAAFGGVDVIDVRVNIFRVFGRVLQRHLNVHAVAFSVDVKNLSMNGFGGTVEILDELTDAVL